MDTSPVYVRMCQMAREIQELCPIDMEGEFVSESPKEEGFQLGEYGYLSASVIWLPRQDQLLGLLSYKNPINYVVGLYRFCVDLEEQGIPTGDNEYARQFRTMEQLTLAFVMGEKFKKRWNGKEWVNA